MSEEILYTITMAGTAFAVDPTTGLKGVKPYEVTFELDKKTVDEMGATSPFCKFLAAELLPSIVPGYVGLQTHQPTNCIQSNGAPVRDIRLMNIHDMELFIKDREYPIEIELYRDDAERLRQAIVDHEQDPAAFAKQQKRFMDLYGKTITIQNRVKALNAARIKSTKNGEPLPTSTSSSEPEVTLEDAEPETPPSKKSSKKTVASPAELGI